MQYVNQMVKIVALVLISMNTLTAQEISASEMKSDVLKMAKHFQKENMELRYSKTIFQNKTDAEPMSQTNGVYYSGVSPVYRLEENSTLTIQTASFAMTIDSSENKVFIDNSKSNFSPVNLDLYKNDTVLAAQKFTKTKKGNVLIYTIQSRETDNGIIELYVNEKDYFLYKMNFYMPEGNYFQEELDDESVENPLLIITYTTPKALLKTETLFKTDNWLNTQNIPFTFMPTVKGYELIDLRYLPKTTK